MISSSHLFVTFGSLELKGSENIQKLRLSKVFCKWSCVHSKSEGGNAASVFQEKEVEIKFKSLLSALSEVSPNRVFNIRHKIYCFLNFYAQLVKNCRLRP